MNQPTIRALQASGKLSYSGITHYRANAHAELERVLGEERFDWLQVNYSLAEPEAEARLLPFCRARDIAVMVNRPFADGALFARVRDKALPPWAGEVGCASWGQFFLRWAASNPAVTCVIPATAKPRHVTDNCGAGHAPLPDERQRARMRSTGSRCERGTGRRRRRTIAARGNERLGLQARSVDMTDVNIAVIGAGMAGLACASELARAELRVQRVP